MGLPQDRLIDLNEPFSFMEYAPLRLHRAKSPGRPAVIPGTSPVEI